MFPIWANPLKQGQMAPLPYGAFQNLPGIPNDAHTIIERVQPYYPIGSANTALQLLNALSNIDKHRRLALTRSRAQVFHNVTYQSGVTTASLTTLDHGAEVPAPYIGEDDPIVDMQRSATLAIAFDEREALGDATLVGIYDLLEGILSDVLLKIVDPLRLFLN
jgi:hypothetical protein